MLALVKTAPGPGLELRDVPVPTIGINDVLIEVLRTGICGTDLHIYNWDAWAPETIPVPMVVGHEFVGQIVEVGSNVTTSTPATSSAAKGTSSAAAAATAWPAGGTCARTRRASASIAPALRRVPRPADDQRLGPRPASIPRRAAIFDPFGNAVHTALSFDLLGEDVLITGAGPIGFMAAAVVRHAGARHVVVTDVNPYRLELAKKMGATLAVDVREQTLRRGAEELGMKEGFDVGLEMSGNAAAFRDMLANMAHGGKIAMLGIPDEEMAIDWNTSSSTC